LQAANVTVIFLCGYYATFEALMEGLERADWTPTAVMVGSPIANSGVYESRIEGGWWQGAYAFGNSNWHWKLPGAGAMSGLTAEEFRMAFFAQFGEYPTEQASGQFGQLLMLVAAIEIAQSLDSNSVARELQRLKIQDIYGDFSYRKQEGMSAKPGLGVQFAPGSHDQDIIHPMGVSSGPLYFPTPTWKTRACRAAGASKCSANGYCSVSGKCICRPAAHGEWTGSACDEWEPYVPPPSWGAIVVAPVVSIVAGFLALAFARNHVRRKMLREGDKKRMHQTFKNIGEWPPHSNVYEVE